MKAGATMAERYVCALRTIPAPGTGCHQALLGVANYGVMAGVARERMVHEILGAIPAGERPISIGEVAEAVDRAFLDYDGGTSHHFRHPTSSYRARRVTVDKDAFLRAAEEYVAANYAIEDYKAELWDASSIRMDWPPEEDPAKFLRHVYSPDELVFIGDRHSPGVLGETIRSAREWEHHFKNGGRTAPHIMANPLTGHPGKTKSGKRTLRGDECVASHRFAVVEFDDIPKPEQAAFFMFARLPIAAIIDSGGKSLHGWVRVDADNADIWTQQVEGNLFGHLLGPLGIDSACKNESRMSRLPGHLRDTGNRQRLLYLAPSGKAVGA